MVAVMNCGSCGLYTFIQLDSVGYTKLNASLINIPLLYFGKYSLSHTHKQFAPLEAYAITPLSLSNCQIMTSFTISHYLTLLLLVCSFSANIYWCTRECTLDIGVLYTLSPFDHLDRNTLVQNFYAHTHTQTFKHEYIDQPNVTANCCRLVRWVVAVVVRCVFSFFLLPSSPWLGSLPSSSSSSSSSSSFYLWFARLPWSIKASHHTIVAINAHHS